MMFEKLRSSRVDRKKAGKPKQDTVQLPTKFAEVFTGAWSWKVDAPCLAVVALAVWIDRYLDAGIPKEVLNLLALFCLGYILKRNLRRDVKFRHLKGALRDSQWNSQGRIAQWIGKVRGADKDTGR